MAGIAASIAAARQGSKVVLIQNRPVLGGNASSEVRVWVCGATATGHQRFARETGIIGELYLENQYRNPEGNPVLWDAVLLDAVRAEPNITLLLNTDVREISTADDRRRIRRVVGWTAGSETEVTVEAQFFLDCTGDGLVGHLAGCGYRLGREAQAEYGESWAPLEADSLLLGSTILFYTKDMGHEVRYVAPNFAKDITKTPIPQRRIIRAGDNGAAYWWIEYGGELDTTHDNEEIRDELWAVIHGIWDYIKNSGEFDAENLTLEWVGSVPGKREYRRFIGAHTLTQDEVMEQREFPDAIGFGGWSIDLHPAGGMYADEGSASQWYPDGVYQIPFRCLYSLDVDNLLFAGRNISATHVAFGTTRVMATCAVMGEAIGTAASLCTARGTIPAELPTAELQRTLLRADASMVGIPYVDSADLAQSARVSASSTLTHLGQESFATPFPLVNDVAFILPVDPALESLDLLVDVDSGDTQIDVEVWETGRPQNYVPHQHCVSARVDVQRGEHQWISVPVAWHPHTAQNAFVIVRSNESVSLRLAEDRPPGVITMARQKASSDEIDAHVAPAPQLLVEWHSKALRHKSFCFRAYPETAAFSPTKAVGGLNRPVGGPQMWVSEGMANSPTLTLELDEPTQIGSVTLVLDDDVHEYLNNLHYQRSPFEIMPTLLCDYRVQYRSEGAWQTAVEVEGNRHRHNQHRFASPVIADALRVVCLAVFCQLLSGRLSGKNPASVASSSAM